MKKLIPYLLVFVLLITLIFIPATAMAGTEEIAAGTHTGDLSIDAGGDCTLAGDAIVTGNLKIEAGNSLDLAGHTLTVNKDATISGMIDLDGGTLNVMGNMNVADGTGILKMTNDKDNDKLTVGGKLTMDGADTVLNGGSTYYLINGTIILKGGFEQKVHKFSADNKNSCTFYPKMWGSLKVIFDGGQQLVVFNSPDYSRFLDIKLQNGASFAPGSKLSLLCSLLDSDLNLKVDDLYINGDLNKHKLTVDGNLHIGTNSELNVNGGSVYVKKNMTVGRETNIFGQSAFLNMTNADDFVKVDGNFSIDSSVQNNLTNGVLWIGGNFSQGDSFKDVQKGTPLFAPSGSFKTVLENYPAKTAQFASSDCKFYDLYLPGYTSYTAPTALKYNKVHLRNGHIMSADINGKNYSAPVDSSYKMTVKVPFYTTSAIVKPYVADQDDTYTIVYNGKTYNTLCTITNLPVGKTNVLVKIPVLAAKGETAFAQSTIELVRYSDECRLSGLAVSAGTLTPVFAADKFAYSLTVPYGVGSVTLTPVKADAGESIAFTNADSTGKVTVSAGQTKKATVTVTAQDGTTKKTYNVNVTRATKNGTLTGIQTSKGKLSPKFGNTATTYVLPLAKGVTSVKITAVKAAKSALVKINGGKVGNGALKASKTITVKKGVNKMVMIDVTAPGSKITMHYEIMIKPAK